MAKYIKCFMALLSAMMPVILCATGCQFSSKPARTETLDKIRFISKLDGGETDIRFWGDGKSIYYYFLPSGCGLESLSVQTYNGITLRKENAAEKDRLTFSDQDTLKGIEYNTVYLLGCYDENQYLYEVPVVFMQGKNIHSVFITTENGTIGPVLDDRKQKIKGNMMISDAAGSVVYQGGLTYIKGRGNGSWFSHKKPFNIKLSEKTDLLGMGISREWCLINQEWDYSYMRNKLIYDLAKDAGMAYSPDSEFVDVWFDGEYFGLYLLTDRIDISESSVDITNLEEATEAVNMEKLSAYPSKETAGMYFGDTYSYIKNDPGDITGGYLLEVDKYYGSDKKARFDTERLCVTLKSPEYISENQFNYIKGFVCEMEDALTDLESTRYQDYIDVESWVKMCILQEISANGDFMSSSQYFYKETDIDGVYSKLYAGPVWDMDLSLGGETHGALPANVFMNSRNSWVKYLYQRPEYYEKLVSVYLKTYRPLVQELLDHKIDSLAQQINASAAMNFTRWETVIEERLGVGDPFLSSIEKLKKYLNERVAFLDGLWVNEVNYHAVHVITDKDIALYEDMYHGYVCMVEDGKPLGELRTPTPPKGHRFGGWYYGTPNKPGEAFDLDALITEDCKIHAKYVPLSR